MTTLKKGLRLIFLLMLVGLPSAVSQEITGGPPLPFFQKPRWNNRFDSSRKARYHPQGTAAWYSKKDPYIRRHTANGEIFDDSKSTCAVWDFPFGTYLKVTNLENRKSVICRVNDRGPAKRLGRRIDLTQSAFRKIACLRRGVIKVSVNPVTR